MTQKVLYLQMGAIIGSQGRIVEEDRLLYAQDWDGRQWVTASSERTVELFNNAMQHVIHGPDVLLTVYYDLNKLRAQRELINRTREILMLARGRMRLPGVAVVHEEMFDLDLYGNRARKPHSDAHSPCYSHEYGHDLT